MSRSIVRSLLSVVSIAAIAAAAASCASAGDSAGTADPKCMAGIACTTDNPGACAAGHTVCGGDGKSTCMPDVMQQPCYTGEPETTNRGVCHGGMQSCIGTLGACMGQQLPAAAENCYNDVDDDCDGHINDGCPASVTVGDPDPLSARGGTGGNPTSSMCPPGTLVTGVQVQLSANNVSPGYVVSLQPSCATPSL